MEKIKCITFDKAAQDAIPQHIKDKMKADRDKAEKELESKGLNIPCVVNMALKTKLGEDRTTLNGYEELIRLPFEQQREILIEVIDMMNHDEWRYKHRNDLIKEVIETSINIYYQQK